MTVIGGRGGRPDDWSSPHERARARAAERLDGPLEAAEAAWLDEHLASCAACAAAAADYASQRLELRALRDRMPAPPRDLWARTAAAIEREPRHRSHGTRRRSRASAVRPYALLAGALVVALAVGTLTSSQRPFGEATTPPGSVGPVAVATPSPTAVAPTPIAVGQKDVAWVTVEQDGTYSFTRTRIDEVCPAGATHCVSSQPRENTKAIGPLSSPETVFGSEGQPLVVFGGGDDGATLVALTVPTDDTGPVATPEPSETATTAATTEPTTSPELSSTAPATATPEATATPAETATVTPSAVPTPSASEAAAKAVEIAHGLRVIDTTAAYAPDGSAFAFTAQPADGSHGPDIYVWTVGDKTARAVTNDHRSVFGSWSGNDIVGSSVTPIGDGSASAPTAFVVRDSAAPAALPATGRAWRPAVDPRGESAVYWAGTLEPGADGADWRTVDGRLVLGRWGEAGEAPDPSASPATAPSDQAKARHETTIAEGPLADWDARWDQTGTRLAVWIADPADPSVGKLSLYVVDPFDGTIDLAHPPLRDEPALAGFSIDDGRLAWAAPPKDSDESRVLVLAWTADGFGKVESAPGDFLLVR